MAMKWLMAVLGALLVAVSLVFGFQIGGLRGQLDQARAQVAAQQRADQQAQATVNGELATERAAFAQAEARIGGTHRNLLTCGDLIEIEQNLSYSWQSAGMSGPVTLNTQWLPGHCYNQ